MSADSADGFLTTKEFVDKRDPSTKEICRRLEGFVDERGFLDEDNCFVKVGSLDDSFAKLTL